MVGREEQTVEGTVVFGIRWDGGRRPRKGGVLAVLLAVLAAALAPGVASAHGMRSALVVPAHGKDAAARTLVARLGGHAGRRIGIVDGFAARVPAGALARLAHAPSVRVAAPDAQLSVRSASEDDAAGTAAASSDVVRGASGADEMGETDGAGVGVALVDSGAMDLPALHGRVITGPDFSSEADDPDLRGLDTFGHGTHLAGVIAGDDPADGFEGVAPGAHVVSVKVADANGQTSLLRVLAALEWVREHHADRGVDVRVVNLSLGVDPVASSYVREPLAFAVEQLWRSGLVVVAAAGNKGPGPQLDLPAADPFVIAVGGVDTADTADRADDTVASFSSRGGSRVPDVLAPATRIVSLRVPGSVIDQAWPNARIGDGFFRGSGTSQATAVVSALAALLLERDPGLDPDQVKALLVAGALPLTGAHGPAAGPGEVDVARSAELPVPSAESAAQSWTPAVLDLHRLRQAGRARQVAFGRGRGQGHGSGSTWSGSTWSGSTWSGSTWSGSTWSGSTWSGSTWSGSTWSDASWDGPDGSDRP